MSRIRSHIPTLGLLSALALGLVFHEIGFSTTTSRPDEAIEEAMQGLGSGMKKLSRSIGDPEMNEATLATLDSMQQHALAAKGLKVPNLDEVKEEDRDAHQLSYRADMAKLLRELCEMEIEVCDGKNDKAKARVRANLLPLRNDSHEKYQEE